LVRWKRGRKGVYDWSEAAFCGQSLSHIAYFQLIRFPGLAREAAFAIFSLKLNGWMLHNLGQRIRLIRSAAGLVRAELWNHGPATSTGWLPART
jgi:hypothetical protein